MIAFAAPIIIFLLSVNSAGIQKAKNQAEIEKKEFLRILAAEINNEGLSGADLKKRSADLTKSEKAAKNRIDRLTPKVQITKIFIPLLLALLFILVSLAISSKTWDIYTNCEAIVLVVLSFISLVVSLWFIKDLSWEIITTKQTIEEEGTYTNVRHSDIATAEDGGEPVQIN